MEKKVNDYKKDSKKKGKASALTKINKGLAKHHEQIRKDVTKRNMK